MKIAVTVHYKNGSSEVFQSNGLDLEGHICDIYLRKKILKDGTKHKINLIDIKISTIQKIEIVFA